jgi:hypothetical protein
MIDAGTSTGYSLWLIKGVNPRADSERFTGAFTSKMPPPIAGNIIAKNI